MPVNAPRARVLSAAIIAGGREREDGGGYSCIMACESASRQALILSRRHTQQRFSSENGATSEPQTTQPFFFRSGFAACARAERTEARAGAFDFFAICFQLITA